jgi:ribonuclease HII
MWVVGIDEAGYGPNLGPLAQAAVAVPLPDDDPAGWKALKKRVRRCRHKDDSRLLIDDSKKVYAKGGFAALERGAACGLNLTHSRFADLIASHVLPALHGDLHGEHWFQAEHPLPCEAWDRDASPFDTAAATVNLMPTARFNRICDQCGSKGAVLAWGVIELIPATLAKLPDDGQPVAIHCDKQGGRNFYSAMLQQAFPDGWVVAECESADESRYQIDFLPRSVTVTFRPRADGDSIAVALASMLCKWLREVCMRQFNGFWMKHVPGIEPTAGYPGDARRFYDLIRPVMDKLGLNEEHVWRKR